MTGMPLCPTHYESLCSNLDVSCPVLGRSCKSFFREVSELWFTASFRKTGLGSNCKPLVNVNVIGRRTKDGVESVILRDVEEANRMRVHSESMTESVFYCSGKALDPSNRPQMDGG